MRRPIAILRRSARLVIAKHRSGDDRLTGRPARHRARAKTAKLDQLLAALCPRTILTCTALSQPVAGRGAIASILSTAASFVERQSPVRRKSPGQYIFEQRMVLVGFGALTQTIAITRDAEGLILDIAIRQSPPQGAAALSRRLAKQLATDLGEDLFDQPAGA